MIEVPLVSWRSSKGRWVAQARVNNRVHHLGYFDDELEAARVAAEFRAEHMPHANAERDRTEFVDERETQEVPV